MLKSKHNPKFANVSNDELAELYIKTYRARAMGADTLTDTQLDDLESELFWIDDELCARDLDLPRFQATR